MEFLWLLTLGVLAAGYFATAGYDYGTGVLLRVLARAEPERRRLVGAVGPFFLGNEVWLVALTGVLLGVFPKLEGRLFAGAYPVVVVILLSVVVFTTAVLLRGLVQSTRPRLWDALITVGAAGTAIGWGVLLGAVLTGLPLGADGYPTGDSSGLLTPASAVFGVLTLALFTLHGAVFVAARGLDDISRRAVRVARLLVSPCVVAVLAAAAVGLAAGTAQPAVVLGGFAVVAALLLLAHRALAAGRTGFALGCTAGACALPVLVVGAAHFPDILVSSVDGGAPLRLADAASTAATVGPVAWMALPVVPAVIALQLVTWWIFRARPGSVPTPS